MPGPVPMADAHTDGGDDSLMQPVMSAGDGLRHLHPLCQPGRDRRGQQTAGAVGVAHVDPGGGEIVALGPDQPVRAQRARGMAALHQHPVRTHGQQRLTLRDGGRLVSGGRDGGQTCGFTRLAERMIDDMVEYASGRQQFGRPIAEFQLIQAMFADSKADAMAARALVLDAARRRDAGEDVSMAAACAKMFASEMVGRVADRNVQVHGGNGYIREYRAEQLFRDARLYRIYEGTTQIQQTIIAKALVAEANEQLGGCSRPPDAQPERTAAARARSAASWPCIVPAAVHSRPAPP